MSLRDYIVEAACAILTIGSLLHAWKAFRAFQRARRRTMRRQCRALQMMALFPYERDRFAMEAAKWN